MIDPYAGQNVDPRCNRQCKGTDRPNTDSPTELVRIGAHRQVLVCTCCSKAMRKKDRGDFVGDDLPAMPPEVARGMSLLMYCPICDYDVRVLDPRSLRNVQ